MATLCFSLTCLLSPMYRSVLTPRPTQHASGYWTFWSSVIDCTVSCSTSRTHRSVSPTDGTQCFGVGVKSITLSLLLPSQLVDVRGVAQFPPQVNADVGISPPFDHASISTWPIPHRCKVITTDLDESLSFQTYIPMIPVHGVALRMICC